MFRHVVHIGEPYEWLRRKKEPAERGGQRPGEKAASAGRVPAYASRSSCRSCARQYSSRPPDTYLCGFPLLLLPGHADLLAAITTDCTRRKPQVWQKLGCRPGPSGTQDLRCPHTDIAFQRCGDHPAIGFSRSLKRPWWWRWWAPYWSHYSCRWRVSCREGCGSS